MELNQAIDNVWKCQFVGIFEFYEESLLILSKYLGWSSIIGEKLNVARKKIKLTRRMIDEAAEQLREIRRVQNELSPIRQYADYLVGDDISTDLSVLEQMIKNGSPIDIWMNKQVIC